MNDIDVALLLSEWARGIATQVCPCCLGAHPSHKPGCEMDRALSERGWTTQDDRSRARFRIDQARSATIPPPVE